MSLPIDGLAWTADGELRCPVVVFGEGATQIGEGTELVGEAGGVRIFVHRYAYDTQSKPVAVALLGDEAVARAWAAYGGPEPVAVAEHAQPLLRALVRSFVQAVRTA